MCEGAGIAGLVLTGGNDLAVLGGDAPERDAVENALLDLAERRGLPVLGVCRGMQVIQQRFAIPLRRVEGHVAQRQVIRIDGEPREVNSYHHFAAFDSRPPLDVWAVADDGVVKAIRHSAQPMAGIMWHPERFAPFSPADVVLFRKSSGSTDARDYSRRRPRQPHGASRRRPPEMLGRARRQAVDRAPDRGAPAWRGGRDWGRPRLSRRDDRFSRSCPISPTNDGPKPIW